MVLLFPSFFLCNFLSSSLCFCRSGSKDLPPSVFSFSLVLSFPFCRSGFTPPVFSSILSPPPSLFSPAFGSSSGFYSQRTRVFLVRQRASRWRGLSAAIRSLLDLETPPLSLPTSPSFIITEYQLLQMVKWWKRRHLGFF